MATPQRSYAFSLRRHRAPEKDSPPVDTRTIDTVTVDTVTVDTAAIDTPDFRAYTSGNRGQYVRGIPPPLPFSTELAAELSTEPPITPPIGTPT